jgi:hypothetical protein
MQGLSWFCHLCWQDPARGFAGNASSALFMASP